MKKNEEKIFVETSEEIMLYLALKYSEKFLKRYGGQIEAKQFSSKKHRKIFEKIEELFKETEKVNFTLIASELSKSGEFEEYKKTLENIYRKKVDWENHEICYKNFLEANKRIAIKNIFANLEVEQNAFELKESDEILNDILKQIENVNKESKEKFFFKASEMAIQKCDRIDELKATSDVVIKTGFENLDKMFTVGLEKGALTILAARPAMGKSAFALNIGQNVAGLNFDAKPKGVLMISLEMSNIDTTDRSWSRISDKPLSEIKNYGIVKNKKVDYNDVSLFSSLEFWSSDNLFYLDDMEKLLPSFVKSNKIELIIIDYLQLIQVSKKSNSGYMNRVNEISQISRSLKLLAKKLDVHIIALSQLSRSLEQRTDKRPIMSDLRESGSIEQDADNIIFLYRPNYYKKEEEKTFINGGKDPVEIIIAKQRAGETGSTWLLFEGAYQRFRSTVINFDCPFE